MRHDKRFEELEALGDWKLEHSSQDIRGRPLVSPEGHQLASSTTCSSTARTSASWPFASMMGG